VSELRQLFFRGFIVGPDESKDEFEKRVAQAKIFTPIHVYDFSVDWLEVVYSNKGLRFWEGACTWINKDEILLQLRKSLKRKPFLFGLYSRQEILEHEAIHAMRMKFHEPIFEEYLAYQTSQSPLRRFLGPLFRRPIETSFFMALIAILPFAFPYIILPFLGYAAFLWIRLHRIRRFVIETEKKLQGMTQQPIRDLILALTDKEIKKFGSLSLIEIEHYIQNHSSHRWKQIKATFFAEKN
jgi:hypothetical protein